MRANFKRLKEFMTAVDKEIAQMAIFKQSDAGGAAEYAPPDVHDENDKFGGINSVQQLKLLMKNYDALVES